jgi:transcriptional regulator with XRE-family HTH domain
MNVLKPEKRLTMVTLLKKKISQHEISRKVGIDRKTIRKYIRQNDLGSLPENKDFLPIADGVATGHPNKKGPHHRSDKGLLFSRVLIYLSLC